MADESATLEILVKARNQAKKELDELNKQLARTSKTALVVNRSFKVMRKGVRTISKSIFSLKAAIAGVGLGILARSFLKAADNSEQLQIRLRVILGSLKEANRLFAEVESFAGGVAFEFGDISQAATQLAGVMEGGVDEVTQWLPLIADLAATSGLGIEQTTSQVIRMYSAGAASADLFRERGINAMLGFTAGVQVSAEETRKRLIAAWEDPASKFRGASELLSTSWSGMLSMMSDAWLRFRNMVMDEGLFDFIRAALSLIVEGMKELQETGDLKVWAKTISDTVITAMTRIAQAIAIVADAWRGWQMIWEGLKGGFAIFAHFVNRGIEVIGTAVDLLLQGIGIALQNLGAAAKGINFGPLNDELAEAVENTGKILQHAGGTADMARENAEFWAKVVEESDKNLVSLVGQESALTKVNKLLSRIKDRAAEYAEAAKAAGDAEARPRVQLTPEATLKTTLEFDLGKAQQIAQTGLAKLETLYDQNLVSLQSYYDQRSTALEDLATKELRTLRILESAETNVDKKKALGGKIFAVEQKLQRDRLALGTERRKAEEDAEKNHSQVLVSIQEMRASLVQEGRGSVEAQFALEQEQLALQQANQIQQLKDLKASEDEIEESHRLHQLQRDQQVAQQRLLVQQMATEGIKTSLNFLESAFSDAYEASGKSTKEFFYLSKAAAVAQTAIATYEAAQKAYSSLAGIPYVGPALGIAAAAAAIAAGIARVAKIKAQSLAGGGAVLGSSPTTTSDNIPINATAGEFMHPVKTAKYYGGRIMEAIRQRAIPREALLDYAAPVIQRNYGDGFQTGGQVAGAREAGDGSADAAQPNINLINVVDPNMMDQYVSSTHGQRNIVNVIGQNAFQIKAILQSE